MPYNIDNVRLDIQREEQHQIDIDQFQFDATVNSHLSKFWNLVKFGTDVSEQLFNSAIDKLPPGERDFAKAYVKFVFTSRDVYTKANDSDNYEDESSVLGDRVFDSGLSLGKLNAILEGDDFGESTAVAGQLIGNVAKEKNLDALSNLFEIMSNDCDERNPLEKELKKRLDFTGAIVNSIKAGKEAGERGNVVSDNRRDLNKQFAIERAKSDMRLAKLKNKLYHLTGGKEGELYSGPKSEDVFTRIEELIEEIRYKIQHAGENF